MKTPPPVPADPRCVEHSYRGARFTVTRHKPWGTFAWYVGEIKLPWMQGTMIALMHEAGWFAWTYERLIRKVCRTINKQFAERERNGKSVEVGALAADWAFEPLPTWPLPDDAIILDAE